MLFQIISILVLHSVYAAVLPPVPDLNIKWEKNGTTIGGVPIDITEAPFNVAILDVVETTTRHHCGGTILRQDTIVTSGFCIYYSIPPGEYPHRSMVKAGTNFHGFGGQQIWVKKMILHPDFNYESYRSNIGIIILEKDIKFGSVAAPVVLPHEIPDPNATANITHGELTGWSKTSTGGKSENLLKFIIPLSDQVRCKMLYPEDVICADVEEDVDDEDMCFGDVGNPLVVDGVLLGITLWSFDCGTPDSPWIFTNVAPYVDWLDPPETTTEEPATTTEDPPTTSEEPPTDDTTIGAKMGIEYFK